LMNIMPNNRGGGRQNVINYTFAPVIQPTIGDIASNAGVTEALREYAMQWGQSEVSKLERMLNPA
jgi:hypothetical protein